MKKIIYLMLSAIAIGFTSCNDNFMELYPDTSLTEKTVFSNYNTFKTYSWDYTVYLRTEIFYEDRAQAVVMPVPYLIKVTYMPVT